MFGYLAGVASLLFVVVLTRKLLRRRGRFGGVGTGAVGAMYGFLNEDKRQAVEIIVEGQAEARRPEYPDGNLPDLESPKPPPKAASE